MKKDKVIAFLLATGAFFMSSPPSKFHKDKEIIEVENIENAEISKKQQYTPTPSPEIEIKKPESNFILYKVQPGDTLYQIAIDNFNDPDKIDLIVEYNKIEDPNNISVGQILKIPDINDILYSNLIEKIKDINFEDELNNMHDINYYGYINNSTILFDGIKNDDNKEVIEKYQKVFILKSSNNIALVITDEDKTYYALASDINIFQKKDFVEVDISNQQTNLYLNNQLNYSTPNVTGKDSSQTDYGCFDIDDKAMDVTLTDNETYWSYVKYWMPYNGGEGLHDADGWRSEYGGEIYHNNGSHGCINMPLEAVEYIYNHVDIGTIVLVHK